MRRDGKIEVQHREEECSNYKPIIGQKIMVDGIKLKDKNGNQINACIMSTVHIHGYNRCDLCQNFKEKNKN